MCLVLQKYPLITTFLHPQRYYSLDYSCTFPGGSVVKNPPAVHETWIRSLSQEDPLRKGMANHSNILAWRISWTEEPGGLQSMGSQSVEHD